MYLSIVFLEMGFLGMILAENLRIGSILLLLSDLVMVVGGSISILTTMLFLLVPLE